MRTGSNINQYLKNFIIEFDKYSGEKIGQYSKEEQFLFLYAYYHYFNADSSCISDIINGNTFRADSDDHISGLYLDEESDNRDIDAVIVFFSDDNDLEYPAIYKSFKEAEASIVGITSRRKRIADFLQSDDYKIIAPRKINIRIITNYIPKTLSQKRSMIKTLSGFHPISDYITYSISFGDDVEYEILEIEDPKEYVDEGLVEIDTEKNILSFGEEKSLIVNVSAISVKTLYELYGYRGLFSQNLRYYVKNAKIDKHIVDSIQNNPGSFWYLNNGIIFICSDYCIDEKTIRLKEFSIVNGGQTTKLIGETDFTSDFYLQCKIIKNKYIDENAKLDFIANVAEASNTQKPIKDKDLIANKPEQRLLKKQLSDAGIYCQIKRGEKVNKKLYPNPWQNTTNEELGQFLLSFVYQMPGTARGNKAGICGNDDYYQLIFKKHYNSGFLSDLLLIKSYYKQWNNLIKKERNQTDPYKIGLVNNGLFFMTSVIGVIYKLYCRRELFEQLRSASMTGIKLELLSQHDIDHNIFEKSYINVEKMNSLFQYCYTNFIRRGYEILKTFKESYNSYSNFTKINANYSTYVFNQIMITYSEGFMNEDLKLLDSLFYQASSDDHDRDEQLLDQYVHVVSTGTADFSNLPDEQVSKIKNALNEYRTETYKKLKIRSAEVFSTNARNRIAISAPKTVQDLKALRCLDKKQLAQFGEEILMIVKKCLSEQDSSIKE